MVLLRIVLSVEMDEDIDAAIVFFSAALVLLLAKKKRKIGNLKISRRFWVHPYLQKRAERGRFSKDVSVSLLFLYVLVCSVQLFIVFLTIVRRSPRLGCSVF